MTTSARRRRRSTGLALFAAVVALALLGVLVSVGYRQLVNSTAGRAAPVEENELPIARLPVTATALVGVVDDSGRLTTTAVFVLEPDGTGGTIVNLAGNADAGFGSTGQLVPLAPEFIVEGPEAYVEAAERLTGLSFDVLEVVDADRFADLIEPLGDLEIVLPFGAIDTVTGERWPRGESTITGPEAARLITALDPSAADWYHEGVRAAVWSAIADRVGAGIGSADEVASDVESRSVATLDTFVDRLFADRVSARSPRFTVLADEQVSAELAAGLDGGFTGGLPSVVAHDRSELSMVLGAIAPARLGAPLEAPRVRLVSGFTDDDLDALGAVDADLLVRALDELNGLNESPVNVVSVASVPGSQVPDVTLVRVADADLVPVVDDTYRELYGGADAVIAGVAIEGVDLEIVLGRSALADLLGP